MALTEVDLGNVRGPTGPAGAAATITVGTVTTGAAGTSASVTNAGTTSAARLNFTIPRGATGATGPAGPAGKTPNVGNNGNWWINGTDLGIFAGTSSFLFVGAHGCQYTTVTAAVEAAKKKATTSKRVCIVVMPGTYTGSITLLPNPGIDIIAPAGAEIIGDKAYPEGALHAVGDGTFVNLTFKSETSGTYALHIEGLENSTPGKQRFVNCMFAGDSAGIGIGEGDDFHQRFERCTFSGGRSIYLHNNPNIASTATARFDACIFQSTVHVQNYTSNPKGNLDLLFVGCSAAGVTYTSGALNGSATDTHYIPSTGSSVYLNGASSNNSNNGLNFGKGSVKVSATGIFLSNGLGIIPMDTAGYTFTPSRILKSDAYTAVAGATASAAGSNLTVNNTSGYSGAFFIEGTLENSK